MLSEELRESLKRLMEPFLKEAQVVLVDLNVHRYHGNFNIEILADKLRDCCEMVSFRHSERSEESFPEEILRRFAPQNDADRHFATDPWRKVPPKRRRSGLAKDREHFSTPWHRQAVS